MAPAFTIENGEHENRRGNSQLTVLVTGFGPFLDEVPVNPSYEIAKLLPPLLVGTPEHPTPVRILVYNNPVRVCYDEVFHLIPTMLDRSADSIDFVLHIGMASGRKFYTLERCAHRDGYDKNKDVDDKMPPPDQGKVEFGDCPAVMMPSLDFEDTLRKWQQTVRQLPDDSPAFNADLRPSKDAGGYLCDYIYFNSLAYYGRRSGNMEGGAGEDRPVLFLHVPGESNPEALEKGRLVTMGLIRAMVESYVGRTENGIH